MAEGVEGDEEREWEEREDGCGVVCEWDGGEVEEGDGGGDEEYGGGGKGENEC